MWELVICIGATWLGCGVFDVTEYETKQECYEVLSTVVVNADKTVAYCRKAQK